MIDGFSLIGASDSFQYGTAESVRQVWIGRSGQFFFQFGNLFLKTGKLPFFSMACKLVGMENPGKVWIFQTTIIFCGLRNRRQILECPDFR